MTTDNPSPHELLAAYADGGLTDAERQRVEAYLADNPQARRELDEIRSMITLVRDNPPEPAREPDWTATSVGIAEAVDAEAARPVGLGGRVRAWLAGLLTPRYALGGLAMAAAAVILFVLATGWLERGEQLAEQPDEIRSPIDDGDGPGDVLEEELDEALLELLADNETGAESGADGEVLDALFEAIDPDAVDAETDAELVAFADGADWPDGLDEVIGELLGDHESGPAGSDGQGGGPQNGQNGGQYDGWLDELSDPELDQLDAMLGEMMAV